MIYNVSGNSAIAFDIHGSTVNPVYDIEGNSIRVERDYSQYTIQQMYQLGATGADFVQGVAYYHGVIFQLSGDKCRTINIDSGMFIADSFFSMSGAGHGDSAMFSNEFYDPSDRFPLLYVSTNASPPTIKIYRVTKTSGTLIRTLALTTEASGYYADPALDLEHNIMYTIGYSKNDYSTDVGGTNFVRIAKYDLSRLTDNGDGTYTPALISTFDTDYWLYVMQGITYYDGYAWVSSGGNGTVQKVYAIDPKTGTIDYTITVGNSRETEGVAWVTDDIGAPWLLIGQQYMLYQKCTFG